MANEAIQKAIDNQNQWMIEGVRALKGLVDYLNINEDTRRMFTEIVCYAENWNSEDPEATEGALYNLERAVTAIKEFEAAHNRLLELVKGNSNE